MELQFLREIAAIGPSRNSLGPNCRRTRILSKLPRHELRCGKIRHKPSYKKVRAGLVRK